MLSGIKPAEECGSRRVSRGECELGSTAGAAIASAQPCPSGGCGLRSRRMKMYMHYTASH